MNYKWSQSLKFKITIVFLIAIAITFSINWAIALNTIHTEKKEAVENVLHHLLVESTDEYITSPLLPSSDVSFLYSIPHNEMILSDSEVSGLRFMVSHNPYIMHEKQIAASIKLSNGYYLNAISTHAGIDISTRKYGEKLLLRYVISLVVVLLIVIFVLDYYMKPLALLASKTREWKREHPFDLDDDKASSEIKEVSNAFSALVRRLEGFRDKETELFKEAAHELKTPLALMRSRLDVYQSKDTYLKEKFTEDLAHDIDRLSSELKNVLFLESSDFEDAVAIDVVSIFRLLEKKMEILIQRKQLRVILPQDTLSVFLPEKLLIKVLSALLENAITYAQENTTIEVLGNALENRLSISNTISPEKYLFSSKIGEKMLKRLSLELGFTYHIVNQSNRYQIDIQFAKRS